MATETHIQEAQPTAAANLLKPGDLWLAPSTGVLKICAATRPAVSFVTVASMPRVPVALTDNTTAIPAGGTGTAAGGWDTAGNRDTAITACNDIRTDLNAVMGALRTAGVIA